MELFNHKLTGQEVNISHQAMHFHKKRFSIHNQNVNMYDDNQDASIPLQTDSVGNFRKPLHAAQDLP